DPLVPFNERFGELVQLLVLPTPHVELDDVESRAAEGCVERLAERRRDTAHLAEPRRVEAAAVPEHPSYRLVLPRGHLLEHVELARDELQAEGRTAQQTQRGRYLPVAHVTRRALDLRRRELQPELRRLVHRLEEQLVRMGLLVRRLLQREQLVRAQVTLVVGGAPARKDRLREVLVSPGR